MTSTQGSQTVPLHGKRKPWILIAAYDVSTGESSEGYIAFNLLRHLCDTYRIILVTRSNNKRRLKASSSFAHGCPGVFPVGYDLPKWAGWLKQGSRFYQVYAYLWQLTWPLAVRNHHHLIQNMQLVHLLNFHNDSMPSLASCLDLPVIWGPINHNEIVAPWRREFWPAAAVIRHIAIFSLRYLFWRIDPFLRIHIRKCLIIFSAGDWVDRRLKLVRAKKVIHRSQLGVNDGLVGLKVNSVSASDRIQRELICAGRLDWIKGIDLAIEALALLPPDYRLRIVGEGPAEARLRALTLSLGLKTKVIFQPPVDRRELAALYSQSALLLFSSAETAGLVWVEALACGLPVVAFEGVSEVTEASRRLPGIYLARGGKDRRSWIESLTATIRKAADTPYDPVALRTAAIEYYSWRELAGIIDNTYSASMRTLR